MRMLGVSWELMLLCDYRLLVYSRYSQAFFILTVVV